MATTKENDNYSHLDDAEESIYIFGMIVIASIGIGISLTILLSFCQQRKEIKHKISFRFAVLSVICSLFLYFVDILFCNNLIISWQFDDAHKSFVSITDSILNLCAIGGKIAFYCSFTYYVLPIFDQKTSGTRKYLIIWMVIACLLLFILNMGYLISDISSELSKEIGITSQHHIYVSMVGVATDFAKYLAIFTIIIDMVYFLILLYFYIKQLKLTKQRDVNGTKGVVLISVSCLIFWFMLILLGISSSGRWLFFIDTISDDVCLYLMYEQQTNIYKFWCKRCDVCCNKFIYGSKGYGTISQDVDDGADDGADQQNQDLLVNNL